MINPAVDELAEQVGVKHACALLGRPRGSHYRAKKPPAHGPAPNRPTPPNALTLAEQAQVLAVLTETRSGRAFTLLAQATGMLGRGAMPATT